MKSNLILVHQTSKLAKVVQKLTGSKWNHVAVIDGQGFIHDFDVPGYRSFPVDMYPHEWERTGVISDSCNPFNADYSRLSLISFPLWHYGFTKSAKFFQSIGGFNCVSWSLSVMGIANTGSGFNRWLVQYPAYFEQFKVERNDLGELFI